MFMNKFTLSLIVASAALLSACSSTPEAKAPEAETPPAPKVVAAEPVAPVAKAETAVAPVVVPEYLDPKNPLSSQRSVYFDFDDYTIKKDYASLVEMHGKFLAANPKLSIRVEGNADERGSSEYNLALGQRRAESVLRALKTFGVKDGQVEPVSWGEEKPKAAGHDEAAWTQNRRADVVYPAK